MKTPITQRLRISSGLALVFAIASSLHAQPAEMGKGRQMMDGKMMEGKMMEARQKMMADTSAQDKELTDLVASINSAPDDKKVPLLARAVTLLVEQRVAMDARRSKMADSMMKHAMWHMQMNREGMESCPMYMNMKDFDDKDEVIPQTPSEKK